MLILCTSVLLGVRRILFTRFDGLWDHLTTANYSLDSCDIHCCHSAISQHARLLYWRDASHNTIDYCIGGMHLTIH